MIAPVMLGILLLLVVSYTCYQNIATRRLYNFSWNDLLGKLEPVPKVTVAQVGNEYLNPGPNQLGLEPADIWLGLGGLEGLRRMRRNARILIALATWTRWRSSNYAKSNTQLQFEELPPSEVFSLDLKSDRDRKSVV